MRTAYYFLCLVPAVLALISFVSPSGWPQGGPQFSFQMWLLITITVLCPLITFIGLLLLAIAVSDRKSKLGLFIATAVAAAPGLLIALLVYLNG